MPIDRWIPAMRGASTALRINRRGDHQQQTGDAKREPARPRAEHAAHGEAEEHHRRAAVRDPGEPSQQFADDGGCQHPALHTACTEDVEN